MPSIGAQTARLLVATLGLTLCAQAAVAQTAAKPRTSLSFDTYEGAEVMLRDVCLSGIIDHKSFADQAKQVGALTVPAKLYAGSDKDSAYRIGPLTTRVYAIAWADGQCSAKVDGGGDPEKLHALAESLILARPEGFVRGSYTLVQNDQLSRTIYCAFVGPERLTATITTPTKSAPRRAAALSSTVYRAVGPSPLCAPTPGPNPPPTR